jgi:hypothetical protein
MLMMPVTTAAVLTPYLATNVIHAAQTEMVESMPEHEQSGMWRTISSAFTGGFNPNVQIY